MHKVGNNGIIDIFESANNAKIVNNATCFLTEDPDRPEEPEGDSGTSRTSDSSGRKIYGSAQNHIVIT